MPSKRNYKIIGIIGAICLIVTAVLFNMLEEKKTQEYQEKAGYICHELKEVHKGINLNANFLMGGVDRGRISERVEKDIAVVRNLKKEHEDVSVSFALSGEKEKVSELLEIEEKILIQIQNFCNDSDFVDGTIDTQMLFEQALKAEDLCQDIKLNAPFGELQSLRGAVTTICRVMEVAEEWDQ
ncbi:MAG: hypothetical protein IJ510_03510 [Selenomonadales bacterium]|nr:hypothetical protein [Selenomonadales bacterium]